MDILEFYNKAKAYVIEHDYSNEISVVKNRELKNLTAKQFLREYVYVVLNAGMRNQTAEKIYMEWLKHGSDSVGHNGKRAAIKRAEHYYYDWYGFFMGVHELEDQLMYLESLPWIGPITKYHLARNLGIDVAKPDRHLTKLAELMGFKDVQTMCDEVHRKTGERVGVVDVVLWRYCNLTGLDPTDPLIKTYLKPDDWGEASI